MHAETLLLLLLAADPPAFMRQWETVRVDSDANFRGLSVFSSKIAWIGGTKGTIGRTADGGRTWEFRVVPGAEKLDFRDIEAFSAESAAALSIGPGEQSRIYRTTDRGRTWRLQFQNREPRGFLDAMSFWDPRHGIALGDPVDGRFQLFVTEDGEEWKRLPEASLPVALPKEGAFAASGTCLVTHGDSDVWFCSGGAAVSRVFHSGDRGKTWSVAESPIPGGVESAGGFSLAFRNRMEGMLVGGDYRKPSQPGAAAAFTNDGGKTWKSVGGRRPFRSAAAASKAGWVAVGTTGAESSTDNGATWVPVSQENFNAVAFSANGSGIAVGPKGRVARFHLRTRRLVPIDEPVAGSAQRGSGTGRSG